MDRESVVIVWENYYGSYNEVLQCWEWHKKYEGDQQ